MSERPGGPHRVEIDRVVITNSTRLDRDAIARLPDLVSEAVGDRLRGHGGGRTGSAVDAVADRVVSEIGDGR